LFKIRTFNLFVVPSFFYHVVVEPSTYPFVSLRGSIFPGFEAVLKGLFRRRVPTSFPRRGRLPSDLFSTPMKSFFFVVACFPIGADSGGDLKSRTSAHFFRPRFWVLSPSRQLGLFPLPSFRCSVSSGPRSFCFLVATGPN